MHEVHAPVPVEHAVQLVGHALQVLPDKYYPVGQPQVSGVPAITFRLFTQVKQAPVRSEHVGQLVGQVAQLPLPELLVQYLPETQLHPVWPAFETNPVEQAVQAPVAKAQDEQFSGQLLHVFYPLLY